VVPIVTKELVAYTVRGQRGAEMYRRVEHRSIRRARGEAGESLAELMVAISILSIAVVAIVGGMAVAIQISTRHREQTTAQTVLPSVADAVKAQGVVTGCATTYDVNAAIAAAGYTVPPGYSVTSPAPVSYLNDSGTAVACSDVTKLQRVTITVNTPRGYAESVDVVVRDDS
jgi:hypothetical protein